MSFHPANIALTGYAPWRVKLLARLAALLGISFHIKGLPFGGIPEHLNTPRTSGVAGGDGVARVQAE